MNGKHIEAGNFMVEFNQNTTTLITNFTNNPSGNVTASGKATIKGYGTISWNVFNSDANFTLVST